MLNKEDIMNWISICHQRSCNPPIITNDNCYSISADAIRNLRLSKNNFSFHASFDGEIMRVHVEYSDVIAFDSEEIDNE